MIPVLKIAAGLVLDFIAGDPQGFPHPVRAIGAMITALERVLLKMRRKRIAGVILVLIVISVTWAAALAAVSFSAVFEILLIYMIFAARSLGVEAEKVRRLLAAGKLAEARVQIGFLVSRDTADLDEQSIMRAAVETVAENIVDAVIAPLFYLFIGGAPLAMAYKAANTLDSMVGYSNEKYIHFGWAGARLDDILNYIPARITGFILVPLASLLCGKSARGSLKIVIRDRLNHSSPNAGHGEAAVAGALGIRLGGASSYFGKIVEKPTIGDASREIRGEDIRNSVRLMYAATVVGFVMGAAAVGVIRYWLM